ncbi:MAG: Rieske (2Fe-2S) protein, partial [Bacteroidota bacterium]
KQGDVEVSNVMVGRLSEIERDSGAIVRFGNKPVILVRLDNGELRAFDGTCTHLDCTVQYRKDMGVIWCACHNGKYDLTGRNIAGPPPRPLDEYKVVTKEDEIFVSKST